MEAKENCSFMRGNSMSEKGFNRFCKTTISLFLLALVFILAPASGWASDNRVQQRQAILVICDYLEMDDLSKPELIHLQNFFGEGSVALLNTNTAGGRNRQNAAATISSGRVALGSSSEYGSEPLIFGPQETFHGEKPQVLFQARTGVTPKPGNLVVLDIPSIQWANQRSNNSAEPGTLGDSLHNKGLKTAAIGNSDVPGVSLKRSAALIAMDSKGIIDQGNVSEEVLTYDPDDPLRHRTDYSMLEELFLQLQPQTDFMVIDLGDLIRLDYKRTQLTAQIYEQEREKILHQYNDFIGMLIQNIDLSNNLLIVAATTPTAEASGEKRLFGFLGAQGDGLEEGLLKTPTTRKEGVIALSDIAPSIGSFLRTDLDSRYIGRTWQVEPAENNMAMMQEIEKRTVFASLLRPLFVKGYVVLHLIILAFIIFFLIFDPKKVNYFTPLLLGLIAVPAALLIACLTTITSLWLYLVLCLIIVAVLVLVSFRLAKDKNYDPLLFLCLVTVFTLLIDTLTGGHLQRFSVLSYDAMSGARYYGIGNEYMGVLMGATIIAATLLAQRFQKRKDVLFAAGGILLSVLVILGAPWWGSNFGGFAATLIAFGYTFWRLLGIRLRPRNILIGLSVVALLCGGVFIFDYLRPPELRSHFGQFVSAVQTSGFPAVKEMVTRKVSMNYKLFSSTIWTKVLLGSLLALGILFYCPVGVFKGMLTKNPAIAAGLVGAMLGAFTALIFNDSGIVAAATAIIFPVATLFYLVIREQMASM
jgi:hypothetical protein